MQMLSSNGPLIVIILVCVLMPLLSFYHHKIQTVIHHSFNCSLADEQTFSYIWIHKEI
uniref:Uncharacterized protein n=1 Tax=Arundo donax TaxID=35708 RepID=A0A0A8ZVL1_ARUDO